MPAPMQPPLNGHLNNVLCGMEYPTRRYTDGQALECNTKSILDYAEQAED